ncbi:MAG TPA: IPT/TIG domain-containing protein [Solirubrobacteraceae bacterium]|nr:IPT/TIG domain-containing protein [Solirubrobacteraceae bacterium]
MLALLPAAASATVTEQQLNEATAKAVSYFRGKQQANGSLGANGGLDPAWAFLGLAGAGVNTADLSTGPGQPSAQDYYLGLWTGPNDTAWTSTGQPQASDYERVIMLANAAGLEPMKLSASQNMLAKMAGFDKNGYFGLKSTLNQTMFASIALDQLPVPGWLTEQEALILEANVHEDGGWTFSNVESQAAYERPGEIDLTGAALAGLCGAGRTASSPAVAKGIAFLESQRSANGQIGNVDSTSWALDGMGACGVKRGSVGWTAGDEHTIEWLLSTQLSEGAWPSNGTANYYATQDALRALVIPGFFAEPPARVNPAEPVRRAPVTVPNGTQVPVVLAINAGFGQIQLCSTTASSGASLPEVLAAAQAKSSPAGCVSQYEMGSGGLTSLNGATAKSGGGWKLSLDNGTEHAAASQTIGFGEVIGLRLEEPSVLEVSATSLEFEPKTPGQSDGTREVTVTNRAASSVNVQALRIVGGAAGDYSIASQSCAGKALGSGASCAITVAFTPGAVGHREATLEVPAEGQGAVAIALRGDGTSAPPPTVTKLSVKKGPTAGGTSVTITGTRFAGVKAVQFGTGNAVSYTVNSETSITAVAPTGVAGTTVDVTILAQSGRSAVSSKDRFKYEKPTVTKVSSNIGSSAGGNRVTITGTGFALGSGTAFKFGKNAATAVECTSTTSCTVTVPAAAKQGKESVVDVIVAVGKSKSKKNPPNDQYTYV